jgi:beta-phosphoglucomutase family hydrolase
MWRAAILDLDGVVTRTARVHERAWKRTFDPFLAERGQPPFTPEDYRQHVDGKPRRDGVRDFLAARGLRPSDADIEALAARKNDAFAAALEAGGVEVFAEAVRQIRRWRAAGMGVALLSASRNARRVLRAAGLEGLFDVRVDGEVAAALGLPGKPAPDVFLEAARRLDVHPSEAIAVEDAVAGVQAAVRGEFGLVVGVARGGGEAALRAAGAHRVVPDLGALADLPVDEDAWTLRFEGWLPERERLREALCTLGNGHFATRGAAEESSAGPAHYPGTYLAGGYDRIAAELQGQILVNEDLVNWPNWLVLTFRPEGGEWLDLNVQEVLSLVQELDLRRGLLERRLRVRDRDGRVTALVSRRFVSMGDPHLAALRWQLLPENWSGRVEIRVGLDGGVVNAGVERYRALRGAHLVPEGVGPQGEDGVWIAVRTRQSFIRMGQAARTRIWPESGVTRRTIELPDRIEQVLSLQVAAGRPVTVEKVLGLYSSRDWAMSAPASAAREAADAADDFATLEAHHRAHWKNIWRRCDIALGPGAGETSRILRMHIFHLLQVASPLVVDRDVGVPARGLHGEAYRGHVFWDELFIFPFLTYRLPELTRELLMYRYRRLPAARRNARAQGHEGAAYPWQSGSDGREESQVLHLNPRSGRWLPDESRLQRHIDAAVAFNVWQYFEATEDLEFLRSYGAEILLEIARFWASLATWDEALGRYRIRGVVGPDEYHTRLPGAEAPGLDDNAYTNVMAVWCLRCAERALPELGEARRRELLDELNITDRDLERWRHIASHMRVVFDGHIISQFDGYAGLEELDWEGLRRRHGEIARLDRVLEAEGDTINRYKASKQADVLMLFYLFSSEALVELLQGMGYDFDPAWIPENVDYYLQRTSDGSTLSRVVHAWVLARSDRARSWRLFEEALRSDLGDIQRGTTEEGIHLGAMAGTVDIVQRCYTGAEIHEGVLWLNPRLPDDLRSLSLCLRLRGGWIHLHVDHERLVARYTSGKASCVRVGFAGEVHELQLGERRTFPVK